MLTVGIYISIGEVSKRIELFSDEKISVTSSIQNIADISKIYTDFSQSFTVPATKNNNAIFSHWYDNSLVNSYDARRRKNAYIELDTIPFRNGKIQLESASMKDGKPENYTITFFGNLVSLKDTFRGLLLKDVDFSEFDFPYSGTYVKDRVSAQTTSDVKFPLISSLRPWTFGDSGVDDISQTLKAIDYKELFPALRLSKVMKGISDFYGVTFEGDFLDTDNFTNAYLFLKNGDGFKPEGSAIIVFDEVVQTYEYSYFDVSTNLFHLVGYEVPNAETQYVRTSRLRINFSIAGIPFNISLVNQVGTIFNMGDYTSSLTDQLIALVFFDDGLYQVRITSSELMSFESVFTFKSENYIYDNFGGLIEIILIDDITATQTVTATTSSDVTIQNIMPDIKVEDFFSGLLKMFNLTCYSTDGTTYNIRQIESWYESGDIVDLTQYIFKESMTLDRVKSYKRVNFEYDKSENLISTAYLSANGVQYGNLAQDFDADGDEYGVKLPFETLLFSNLNNRLQVGYTLKTDFNPYIPKPIILYDYGVAQTAGFYLNDGTTSTLLTNYNAFGSETLIGTVTYSLNFGIEQSSLTNDVINDSLYFDYYQNYLANIFTSKARQIKIKGLLPLSILTSLKLNDRVIIQGKRYIINSYTTDLTTGEVDFDLLNDFRIL
jgi:hypothetical protein